MPTVRHFDIPIDDLDRSQKFYRDVFGWDMKKVGNPATPQIELWMCETEDSNGNKGITGGLMRRKSLPTVTNYIGVLSIEEFILKIERSGGKVTVPRSEIPNIGFFAMFKDSENNLFGLFEAKG